KMSNPSTKLAAVGLSRWLLLKRNVRKRLSHAEQAIRAKHMPTAKENCKYSATNITVAVCPAMANQRNLTSVVRRGRRERLEARLSNSACMLPSQSLM